MNLTTTTWIIILVHISIFVIFIIIRKIQKLEKLKLFLIKVINILTFGFYLGFYMEVYILFLLVDFSEISYQLRYGIQNTQSTVTSYIIVSAMLMMFLLTAWQWWKSRNEDSFSKQKYFRAVVEGMKPKWICRSYHLVFLIRRTLFGVIIFFVPFDMMMLRVCLFAGVQGLLLLYILFLRPQEGIKENLIDVINEILYFYFAAFLVYYNSEEKWNSTTTDVYFWILITNNFILIFIMLGNNRNLKFYSVINIYID